MASFLDPSLRKKIENGEGGVEPFDKLALPLDVSGGGIPTLFVAGREVV